MISINTQTLISASGDIPIVKSIGMAGEADGSFAAYLDSGIIGMQSDVQVQNPDVKVDLARLIVGKLKGFVNKEIMEEIIVGILSPIFVTAENKLVIPVEIQEEGIDIINNLMQRSGIGDKIKLISANELISNAEETIPSVSGSATYPISGVGDEEMKEILQSLDIQNTAKDISVQIDNMGQMQANDEKVIKLPSKLVLQHVDILKEEAKGIPNNYEAIFNERSANVLTFSREILNHGSQNFLRFNSNNMVSDIDTPDVNSLEFDDSAILEGGHAAVKNSGFEQMVIDRAGHADSRGRIENIFEKVVINQIAEKVSIRFNKGMNEIKIDLEPPSLGSVHIKVVMKGDGVNTIMVIENNTVKNIVESNLDQLKNALLDQGVMVNEFSVLVGDNNLAFLNHNGRMFEDLSEKGAYTEGFIKDNDIMLDNCLTGMHNRSAGIINGVDVFV